MALGLKDSAMVICRILKGFSNPTFTYSSLFSQKGIHAFGLSPAPGVTSGLPMICSAEYSFGAISDEASRIVLTHCVSCA